MQQTELPISTVVQVSTATTVNQIFEGCFMVVTGTNPWGVQGYIQAIGENGNPGRQLYYRARWDEIEIVGPAVWVVE